MRQILFTLGLTVIIMAVIQLINFIISLGYMGEALVLIVVFAISFVITDSYLEDVDKEILNNKKNESKD